jgi:hypothetical protein
VLSASHLLYAHVHHHYGLNDAFDRSVAILLSRLAPAGDGSPDDISRQRGQQSGRPSTEQGVGGGGTARATGTVQSAVGRHRMLEAPAVLRQRLLLAAQQQDGEAGMQQQVQQQARGRELGELPVVKHPCLHDGYSQQYKRLHLDGAAMPDPPQVVLVGR